VARRNSAPDVQPMPPLAGRILSHASINVRRWRAAAVAALGNACVSCGFTDVRAFQIDHINGGGHHERTTIYRSPRQFYKAVLADAGTKYQILCANCNQIKRVEGV
jgi:hypothetical protein